MNGTSKSGAGGGSAKGELVLPDGSKIEFEGTLEYGKKDKALTGAARTAIESWEKKRVTNKVEYGYAVDANGNPIGKEIRGGKGSVRTPIAYNDTPGGTFTHIHPRGDGMLGGTFSTADLTIFSMRRGQTKRAAAKEGTYSISKGKNFDAAGFRDYVYQVNAQFNNNYRGKANALAKDYRAGKIDYKAYLQSNAKAFNSALVQLHNDYSAGQKKYGYTYTLEKNN